MGVPAMMAGRTKMGRASSPPMPSREKAVSPATAVAGSFPAAASMRNWVAAPKAAPPGTMRLMALPDSCDVVTENHALVRSAIRCNAMVQVKCATWSARAKMNQIGSREVSFGKESKTAARLGKSR